MASLATTATALTGRDAGSVAAEILSGWSNGAQRVLWRETPIAQGLARQTPPPSTFEAERIDVLLGAIESLESAAPERVRAALYILKHLAGAERSR